MTTLRLTHGARSEPSVKRQATTVKRRILRQIGLSAADLSGLGLARLEGYCRAQAKVELMDAWAATNLDGWLDKQGNAPGFTDKYFAALNASRLALDKLEDHLRAMHGKRIPVDLSQYRGKAS